MNHKKVVFVYGLFVTFHAGHFRFLEFAKSCGDELVVGILHTDLTCSLDSVSGVERAILETGLVDKVVRIGDDVGRYLRILRPNYLVKGIDGISASEEEMSILREFDGKVIFSSGEPLSTARFSQPNTSDDVLSELAKGLSRFILNGGHSAVSLRDSLANGSRKKFIVVGEVILDQYCFCDAVGMSREDPTIVVTPRRDTFYLGGAGIVAAHLSSLGAEVLLVSVVGDDQQADMVRSKLDALGMAYSLVTDSTRPTPLKKRYKVENRTLLRVNNLRSHDISLDIQEEVATEVTRSFYGVSGLIFSDFNYGLLPPALISRISEICLTFGVDFFVDSQSSSQFGNCLRYQKPTGLYATEWECRISLADFKSGIASLGQRVLDISGAVFLVMKLGADGLLLFRRGFDSVVQIPALNHNPIDVTGAGDALLSASALTFSRDQIVESAILGAVASGIQVSKTGNSPCSLDMLASLLP